MSQNSSVERIEDEVKKASRGNHIVIVRKKNTAFNILLKPAPRELQDLAPYLESYDHICVMVANRNSEGYLVVWMTATFANKRVQRQYQATDKTRPEFVRMLNKAIIASV